MFDEGIKTSFWISAEIRRCDGLFLPMTILHRGDDGRGLVLVKQYIAGKGCILHNRKRDVNGRLGWHNPLGPEVIDEGEADAYIARQRGYDEDLWVMEVEDPRGQYSPAT
ncbi:MAG: hypothetical protein COB49_07345 [Alphaproteobacteria bacterium]|nr:MAG: hypothetical protein COB49_07345 [Alphaproteobacteria bacterium]